MLEADVSSSIWDSEAVLEMDDFFEDDDSELETEGLVI